MGIYGQDWASYQGSTPSAKGLAFVFLKVTEGLTYESPVWKSQKVEAVRAGAVVGYYHYPHMHNSAVSESNYFGAIAKPAPGELIVLDWEGYDTNNAGLSNAQKLAYKEAYLSHMKAMFPHNPVGLYANTDYWLNVDTTGHAGDFLWIATAGRAAGDPGIKAPWKFHQYGAAGVDKDYGNFADLNALKTWANSFGSTTPVITPTEDDLPFTEAQLRAIVNSEVVKAVESQPVRDTLAFANVYFLNQIFSMKPMPGSSGGNVQALVNNIQNELKALDAADLAKVQAAIAGGITATVNVSGTVK